MIKNFLYENIRRKETDDMYYSFKQTIMIKPQVSITVYSQIKRMLKKYSIQAIHNRTSVSVAKILMIRDEKVEVVGKPKVKDVDLRFY